MGQKSASRKQREADAADATMCTRDKKIEGREMHILGLYMRYGRRQMYDRSSTLSKSCGENSNLREDFGTLPMDSQKNPLSSFPCYFGAWFRSPRGVRGRQKRNIWPPQVKEIMQVLLSEGQHMLKHTLVRVMLYPSPSKRRGKSCSRFRDCLCGETRNKK